MALAVNFFIGYLSDDEIIRPLRIILPQMSGYIKYFTEGSKNMSFKIENGDVYSKYSKIWDKIKEFLNINFLTQPFIKKNT